MIRVGSDNAAVLKTKLREIRYRVAGPIVSRHLSFTRAAQDLFVTQSAISREIWRYSR